MTDASKAMAQAGEVAAVYLPFDSITPWGKNPRHITESAVSKVAIQMCRSGFGAPLLARAEDRRLVAGHTRSRAFIRLREMVEKHGMPPEYLTEEDPDTGEVTYHHKHTPPWGDKPEEMHPPVWFQYMKDDTRHCLTTSTVPARLMDLSNQEADELALADNRLGEEAEWDNDLLTELFHSMPVETHIYTGFDASELEPLLAYVAPEPPENPDGGSDPGAAPPPGPSPGSPLRISLDPGQRVAFEQAIEAAKILWERPDLPAAEMVAELCRQFLVRNPGPAVGDSAPEVDPDTPSSSMDDF